jgi:hypothetical protein
VSIFGDGSRLTEEAVAELGKHADMIECECPTYLLDILEKVRKFSVYTESCIQRFPKDEKTHKWLLQSAQNLNTKLSATIAQLARLEGFIDDQNQFVDRPRPNSI